MGINALTQMLVPPPKYNVDRLVPCRMGSSTRVSELYIIERGKPGMHDLDRETTLKRMIENTDDAYGFPPFRYLAPGLTIDGLGYAELRAKEREILKGFLAGVRTQVISSDCFGWADVIAPLVTPPPATPAVPRQPTAADVWPRWGARMVEPELGEAT
ncbi:hypothetical protein [Dactylosporangium darangshiense]